MLTKYSLFKKPYLVPSSMKKNEFWKKATTTIIMIYESFIGDLIWDILFLNEFYG